MKPSSMPFLSTVLVLEYASDHWGYHAGKGVMEPVRTCALSIPEDYGNHA